MRLWHVTISSTRRLTMFANEQALRRAVRRVIVVIGRVVVLFCFVDDHFHVVLIATNEQIGRHAAALLFVLRALTRVPLERPHVRPVESRDHLEGLVRYFLGQPRKHQLRAHPALYTGTCFSDLIGARTIGDFQPRIFEALPRFRAERACDQVGVPKAVLRPASDEQLRVAGVARLVAAAAAALCVGPELRGKAPAMLDARRLAVHLTDRCGLPRAELPRLLGVSPRTVRRLAHESVSPLALRAARLQIALVDTIHQLPAAVVRAG